MCFRETNLDKQITFKQSINSIFDEFTINVIVFFDDCVCVLLVHEVYSMNDRSRLVDWQVQYEYQRFVQLQTLSSV
jgi:hypothetical protein